MTVVRALLVSTLIIPRVISAQLAPAAAPASPAEAASYEQRYGDLKELQAVPNRVARVSGLVLQRDVARFTLQDGSFYLLTPIAGRTMGAVFLGTGRMSFSPSSRIEQDRLARFQKTKSLDVPSPASCSFSATAPSPSWNPS
jgi:hypothetical protein